jgi:hypothetical protein
VARFLSNFTVNVGMVIRQYYLDPFAVKVRAGLHGDADV